MCLIPNFQKRIIYVRVLALNILYIKFEKEILKNESVRAFSQNLHFFIKKSFFTPKLLKIFQEHSYYGKVLSLNILYLKFGGFRVNSFGDMNFKMKT